MARPQQKSCFSADHSLTPLQEPPLEVREKEIFMQQLMALSLRPTPMGSDLSLQGAWCFPQVLHPSPTRDPTLLSSHTPSFAQRELRRS